MSSCIETEALGAEPLTDSGRFDHIPDCESLYGLVLWCASGAIGAADGFDVAAALLVTSTRKC